MAITRRQFVTTLGALAAAMGVGSADISKITEAFAHGATWSGGDWTNKPKVLWVHGAECTGCSTSLLSLFEDVRGKALADDNIWKTVFPTGSGVPNAIASALDLAVGGSGVGSASPLSGWDALLTPTVSHPNAHRTLQNAGLNVDGSAFVANIADVVIDFIELQYHETIMGAGGDLAAKQLYANMTTNGEPFVLVVEGAVQDKTQDGYYNSGGTSVPWCSIGVTDDGAHELAFDDVVSMLATKSACKAVVTIGQCATFGGYPKCVSPVLGSKQTSALGVYDFLARADADGGNATNRAAAPKVVNVPGCPCNPWWFVLTVVAWMVDWTKGPGKATPTAGPLGILDAAGVPQGSAVDATRRLKTVFGTPIHGPACPRYQSYKNNVFAAKPGDAGCLQKLGCKGPSTNALCAVHGWNGAQPGNDATWDQGVAAVNGKRGGFCITAGAPCMGCSEQGYPDAFVPFINR